MPFLTVISAGSSLMKLLRMEKDLRMPEGSISLHITTRYLVRSSSRMQEAFRWAAAAVQTLILLRTVSMKLMTVFLTTTRRRKETQMQMRFFQTLRRLESSLMTILTLFLPTNLPELLPMRGNRRLTTFSVTMRPMIFSAMCQTTPAVKAKGTTIS